MLPVGDGDGDHSVTEGLDSVAEGEYTMYFIVDIYSYKAFSFNQCLVNSFLLAVFLKADIV